MPSKDKDDQQPQLPLVDQLEEAVRRDEEFETETRAEWRG